jgi:hypothetical protein
MLNRVDPGPVRVGGVKLTTAPGGRPEILNPTVPPKVLPLTLATFTQKAASEPAKTVEVLRSRLIAKSALKFAVIARGPFMLTC